MALSHPVSVAWARELVGVGKARVHERHHHEAPAGGVAPAELVPEAPREDEVAENVADETQVAENLGDDAEAAQASEEEDAPGN